MSKKKSGAPCMPCFGTVMLQSVGSQGLWGGLTVSLPSGPRFERDRTSLRCPPYAAITSVVIVVVVSRIQRIGCQPEKNYWRMIPPKRFDILSPDGGILRYRRRHF